MRRAYEWLVLIAALLVLGGWLSHTQRGEYVELDQLQRDQLTRLSLVLETQLSQQLKLADRSLRHIGNDLPGWKQHADGVAQASHELQRISDLLHGVRTILIIDADGRAYASNRAELIGRDFSKGENFLAARQNPSPETLKITPPFTTVLDTYALGLMRPLSGPDGKFGGLIIAITSPDYFSDLLDAVRYEPDVHASIVHGDGKLFMIQPEQPELVGIDLATPDSLFTRHRASGQPLSIFSDIANTTGNKRLMVLRSIQPEGLGVDKPLMVALSRDYALIIAAWQRASIMMGWIFGIFAMVAVLSLYYFQRRRQAADLERERADAKIRRLNQLYTALSHSNQAIVRHISAEGLFPQFCQDVVTFGGMKLAWIGMVDEATRRIVPVAAFGAGQEYVGELQISIDPDDPHGQGPTGTSVREGQPFWCQDFLADARTAAWHEHAARYGLAASASLPLVREGKAVGTFNLYAAEVNAFDAETQNLLLEMATDIGFALDNYAREAARRAAEAALQAIAERLNEAQRIAQIGSWTLDLLSGELFWSDEIFRLFEIDPAQFCATYEAFLNAIHPDDRDAVNRAYSESLANRTPYAITHRLRMPDGRIKWVQEACQSEFDTTGKPLCSRGTVQDISERVQAEEQQRIAAAAFESQEAMMVTDVSRVILRVNRAFTETTGYAPEEAVGQTPRLLRSGRHSADFHRGIWESIQRAGVWQGEVWNRRKNGEVYPTWLTISAVKNAQGSATHYVGTHFDISERKQAEEKINELAFFDQLTKLPNRTLLLDRLKQAMTAGTRSGRFGALLMIDLDNFKTLNDTRGHDMGDLLLQHVGQRLTTCVRADDTVARLGGDEFMVVLPNLSSSEAESAAQTEGVGEKILAAFRQPFQLGEMAYPSTPSIGVTLFRGHLAAIEDLMKQADLAMYKSKAGGRNLLRFFDPAMETAVVARVELEKDLRQALDDKQFLLHYQPQIAGANQLTGAEVLVRWQHPQRGMVSPAEFIPVAEETGLILPLGQWVLETACAQLALWASRPEMAHITVAVNVSAHQFREADFVDMVLAVIDRTGANPQRLKLELTESMLVAHVEDIIAKMFLLKAQGIGFSLDDFGTGYSSLSYLKRLPLDQLKIDQSFVRDVLSDPNDAAIAKTVVALAQSLGLGVIAEGVETAEQRDFLASVGCHAYQGYFFSRPVPLEKFEAFARPV
jgi:diguanylate cyclase (GGDEF)-like protein/PAS domain S-box-containing protein